MGMDKQEINEALSHQNKIAKLLRQRLQQRELQEAQYGLNTPPEVLSEIRDIRERVSEHEAEIIRLQKLAAEDYLTLAEAEYRVLVAESWENPRGRPTVTDNAKLELARLRLGIVPEQALKIEQSVKEAIFNSDNHQVMPAIEDPSQMFGYNSTLKDLINATTLDERKPLQNVIIGVNPNDNSAISVNMLENGSFYLIMGTSRSGKSTALKAWLQSICIIYSHEEVEICVISLKKEFAGFKNSKHLFEQGYAETANQLRVTAKAIKQECMRRKEIADNHPDISDEELLIKFGKPLVVGIDDYDLISSYNEDEIEILHSASKSYFNLGVYFIVASDGEYLTRSYSMFTKTLKANRRGLLLRVFDSGDAWNLGVRLPYSFHMNRFIAGNGLLVLNSGGQQVQVVLPE